MEKIPDLRLRTYVVWVPVLRAGPLESSAQSESGRIADLRVRQFIDLNGAISKLYAAVLRLPQPMRAWDVYFVFGPDVRWLEGQGGNQPPAPTYWMHQLSGRAVPEELRLDGERLASTVRELLSKRARFWPPTVIEALTPSGTI